MHSDTSSTQYLELTQDAIPSIATLEKQCSTRSWERRQFAEAFSQKSYKAIGAQDPQKGLVGYVSFYSISDEIEILSLSVRPQARRKGYGKNLLYAALRYGASQGNAKAFLEVRSSNFPAITLYESFGFLKNGVRPDYYSEPSENALIYCRSLLTPLPTIN